MSNGVQTCRWHFARSGGALHGYLVFHRLSTIPLDSSARKRTRGECCCGTRRGSHHTVARKSAGVHHPCDASSPTTGQILRRHGSCGEFREDAGILGKDCLGRASRSARRVENTGTPRAHRYCDKARAPGQSCTRNRAQPDARRNRAGAVFRASLFQRRLRTSLEQHLDLPRGRVAVLLTRRAHGTPARIRTSSELTSPQAQCSAAVTRAETTSSI